MVHFLLYLIVKKNLEKSQEFHEYKRTYMQHEHKPGTQHEDEEVREIADAKLSRSVLRT